MSIRGKVWKYGDDINTDVIFPGKYTYTVNDPEEMASHAMEDLDPEFASKVKPNDIIVAGDNFGCGSSREQAAFSLKYAKVGAVIASSFARLYFRNAINAGLPAIESKEAVDAIQAGEEIEVDLQNGEIRSSNNTWKFPAWPDEVRAILDAGGIIPYTKEKIKNR